MDKKIKIECSTWPMFQVVLGIVRAILQMYIQI